VRCSPVLKYTTHRNDINMASQKILKKQVNDAFTAFIIYVKSEYRNESRNSLVDSFVNSMWAIAIVVKQ